MMIEQPLAHDDIIDHAVLQAKLQTPICLDECIRTALHAEQAIQMHACGIINIKLGRVAGFSQAKRVHDIAQAAGIPVWCGGMLEAGIGRAHNIGLPACQLRAARRRPRASAIGSRTSSSPPWKLLRRGRLRCATAPALATTSIWISFAASR
jgi:L-alanine-DL-glutamate epimerase-like enolase superfamily enzyme